MLDDCEVISYNIIRIDEKQTGWSMKLKKVFLVWKEPDVNGELIAQIITVKCKNARIEADKLFSNKPNIVKEAGVTAHYVTTRVSRHFNSKA